MVPVGIRGEAVGAIDSSDSIGVEVALQLLTEIIEDRPRRVVATWLGLDRHAAIVMACVIAPALILLSNWSQQSGESLLREGANRAAVERSALGASPTRAMELDGSAVQAKTAWDADRHSTVRP